ncbi:MAG: kinase-regulated stress-responsive transcription factor skn7 [Watsoniomyces obsoletus]|nr:MAG: kinase-regulated stress-responsive transcription factor skn7 [Watsoniomyces obsoletus]
MASPSDLPSPFGPSMPPPPGVEPNFDNPPSLHHQIIAVATVLPLLAAIFVAVRIYTRAFISRCLWWDDYTAVVGLALAITASGVVVALTKTGLGVHRWNVRLSEFSPGFLRLLFNTAWLFVLLPTVLRTSLCLLYFRIFGTTKPMRWTIYVALVLNWASGICFMCLWLWECSPREAIWNISIRERNCLDVYRLTATALAAAVFLDTVTLLLPAPAVLRLHLPRRQRFAVLGIFMIGSIAVIVTVARLVVYLNGEYKNPDATWVMAVQLMLAIVEANVGLICSCAPVIKPFLRRFFPDVLERTSRGRSQRRTNEQHTQKSWPGRLSQPWHGQSECIPDDDANLELGGGACKTVVQGAGRRSGSQEPIVRTSHEGHIMKTVVLDVR